LVILSQSTPSCSCKLSRASCRATIMQREASERSPQLSPLRSRNPLAWRPTIAVAAAPPRNLRRWSFAHLLERAAVMSESNTWARMSREVHSEADAASARQPLQTEAKLALSLWFKSVNTLSSVSSGNRVQSASSSSVVEWLLFLPMPELDSTPKQFREETTIAFSRFGGKPENLSSCQLTSSSSTTFLRRLWHISSATPPAHTCLIVEQERNA
jgi:hypothetical protein